MSRNSRTPSWAFFTVGDLVLIFIPSVTGSMHDGSNAGPRGPSTSTRHMRHMPTSRIRGCQQNLGMYVPARSAAAMSSSPGLASNSVPSTVMVRVVLGAGAGIGSMDSTVVTVRHRPVHVLRTLHIPVGTGGWNWPVVTPQTDRADRWWFGGEARPGRG